MTKVVKMKLGDDRKLCDQDWQIEANKEAGWKIVTSKKAEDKKDK